MQSIGEPRCRTVGAATTRLICVEEEEEEHNTVLVVEEEETSTKIADAHAFTSVTQPYLCTAPDVLWKVNME